MARILYIYKLLHSKISRAYFSLDLFFLRKGMTFDNLIVIALFCLRILTVGVPEVSYKVRSKNKDT